MSLMLTGQTVVDATVVAQQLAALKGVPLYRFCSPEAQSNVNIAASWVDALAGGRQPSVHGVGSAFLKEVVGLLGNF